MTATTTATTRAGYVISVVAERGAGYIITRSLRGVEISATQTPMIEAEARREANAQFIYWGKARQPFTGNDMTAKAAGHVRWMPGTGGDINCPDSGRLETLNMDPNGTAFCWHCGAHMAVNVLFSREELAARTIARHGRAA